MRIVLTLLIAVTTIAVAQQSGVDDPEDLPPIGQPLNMSAFEDEAAYAWFKVPFEERERRFMNESRDSEWAFPMEHAIKEEVAEFDRPLVEVAGEAICSWLPLCEVEMPQVELAFVECRATLCKIEMNWPPGTSRSVIGQQLSFLYALGIDHQGEWHGDVDSRRYSVELIARRRD